MILQQAPAWTERAIHDTVAVLARHPDYQRSLTDSLWQRFIRWFVATVVGMFRFVDENPASKAVALTLIVVVTVLIVARLTMRIGTDDTVRGVRGRQARGRDERNHMAQVEQLASLGDFTAAAHLLYAVMIDTLAARGEVRAHASKTTGDYVHELRRRSSTSLPAFRGFRARYDRVIYGDLTCSAGDYSILLAEAQRVLANQRAAA